MRLAPITLFVCLLITCSGCSSQSTEQLTPAPSQSNSASPALEPAKQNATPSPNAAAATKGEVDACTLLTSDEIKTVQGEAVKETKPSNRTTGDFIVTQCYYTLPTASNSISVTLTEPDASKQGGQGVRDSWESTFGKDEKKNESERKKEGQEEKKKQTEARREGEEEESAPLEPVKGLGDEAFWSASRVGGALYVLKGDRYIRISVGGAGDAEAKLKKSKALALKALRRL